MALILNIDTSTKSTSVALAENDKLLSIEEEQNVVSHATKLTPFIQKVLSKAQKSIQDLDAIAISIGPGSYTGLRIGLSTAKGLCYSLDIPLITISSLEALGYAMKLKYTKNNKLFVSVMNSRKNELYLCLLSEKLEVIHKPKAIEITANFLQEDKNKEYIISGTGMEKIKVHKLKNIKFLNGIDFSAINMLIPSNNYFHQNLFADLANCEPDYLKPFIST